MKLFICGDIVNYEKQDGRILSDEVERIVKSSDLAICNLEAPLTSKFKPEPKSGPHHYNIDGTIEGLRASGFNLFCLANNHIMDYGTEGVKNTLDRAQELEVSVLGAGMDFDEAYKPYVYKKNGTTVGIINVSEAQFGVLDYNVCDHQPGYAWINHKEVDNIIINLREICDFVIVIPHAGLEHYDLPQKEWRKRYQLFCDLGADVVVGHHPHVPQGFEDYKGSMIFYSLGNFFFNSKKNPSRPDYTYSIELTLNPGEKIEYKPIYTHKENNQVVLSAEHQRFSIDRLNNLLVDEYDVRCEQMNLEVYEKKLNSNLVYSLSPSLYDGGMTSTLKRIIKFLLLKPSPNKKLSSLHLIRNETYYFAIKNALNSKSRNVNYERLHTKQAKI